MCKIAFAWCPPFRVFDSAHDRFGTLNTLKGGTKPIRDTRGLARSALIDEMNLLPHPNRAMIRSGILLAIATLCLAASAQTNSWMPKKMSLEDCVETALHHNLDVRIQRYTPEINLYTLNSVHGAYDPNLPLTISHSYSESSGGIDAQGRVFGSTSQDVDSFSGGLSGLLPWGTTYNLGASLVDTYGRRPSVLTGTNILGFQTNTFFDTTTTSIVSTLSPV